MNIPVERELTAPVTLCDARGRLNPEARGWSRHPLHTCNLSGAWPRKKKWHCWIVTTETFAFCVILANVDYMGIDYAYLLDYEQKKIWEKNVITPFGLGLDNMPETVESSVEFKGAAMPISIMHEPGGIRVRAKARRFAGTTLDADFFINKPQGYETMNVVVPWSDARFQYNSKQNSLPTEGRVRLGSREYVMDPESAFACLDYGRGIWPYKVFWNWSSVCGRQGDDVIAVNSGAGWTSGTGATENAICINGRVTKISEDMVFEYDNRDFMKPWRLRTAISDAVDMTMTPFYEKISKTSMGVLSSEVHQCYGRFTGTIKAQGREIAIGNLVGWAEEHVGRW
jgi:hypothetical protein